MVARIGAVLAVTAEAAMFTLETHVAAGHAKRRRVDLPKVGVEQSVLTETPIQPTLIAVIRTTAPGVKRRPELMR